jgi:hypothetical protein
MEKNRKCTELEKLKKKKWKILNNILCVLYYNIDKYIVIIFGCFKK